MQRELKPLKHEQTPARHPEPRGCGIVENVFSTSPISGHDAKFRAFHR